MEELFSKVTAHQINFAEQNQFSEIVRQARDLKTTILSMLAEEKVSLPAMREVMAKMETMPVNFEVEVEQFQHKMLSAQNWLAKVRKCIPKRRPTRRGGGIDRKKMDLDAIRALVDDAPCDDSVEMFEMQDLLECADEWADKVKLAIEGGADVTLETLRELMDEGREMPVEMEEQQFLEAEIAAREWCTKAASMLTERKPLEELESMVKKAHLIRKGIHPKKQSRWKPQIERDIHAALDTARRWINELRDVVGASAFERLFNSLSSMDFPLKSDLSNEKAKKEIDALVKVFQKSERLSMDVSSYTEPVKELLVKGHQTRQEACTVLDKIGVKYESALVTMDGIANLSDNAKTEAPDGEDATVKPSGATKEPSAFAHACALLEQIDSLPFSFEEGLLLERVVHKEREWAQRVRDALPPRQSRKKRQAKNQITLEQLQQLLNESKQLHFQFPEELKILARELNELSIWQAKAHHVVEDDIVSSVFPILRKLKAFDLRVYEKLQAAKQHFTKQEEAKAESSECPLIIESDAAPQQNGATELDVEMADTGGAAVKDEAGELKANQVAEMTEPSQGSTGDLPKQISYAASKVSSASLPILSINVDAIMSQVRLESGCMRKEKKNEDIDDAEKANLSPNGTCLAERESTSILGSVLDMVEESLKAVNALEVKEDSKSTVDLAFSDEDNNVNGEITDEAVKLLETWKEKIKLVIDEGALLSATAPEMHSLLTTVRLLDWLQSARSIFYDEVLPSKDLVGQGKIIDDELKEMRFLSALKDDTMDVLELMLWPLKYLEAHEKIVINWTERMEKCMEDKHASLTSIQQLLGEGSGLLLEPDAFSIVLEEVKKAKLWLSKLKKRVKSLITKHVNRLSMSVARSLVEEGEDIAIELPAFDFLKEHVDVASDWETRVLDSGIESGQARIAHLLGLLNEYDCARLVIDLDMHRDVLKSATERYCICRQPFDGLMIGCDHCDDWFHDNCIGMSKEKAEKVEHYTCPSCTILQGLSAALQQITEERTVMWDLSDHAKNYEKNYSVALRKVKREEKAIERSEMLHFSCNNHLNQLHSRIEDIERAKAALSIAHSLENSRQVDTDSAKVPVKAAETLPTAEASSTASASTATPVSAATVPASLSSFTSVVPETVPAAAVAALAGMETLAFANRYPNILLPPPRYNNIGHSNATSVLPMSVANSGANGVASEKKEGSERDHRLISTSDSIPQMLSKISENTERLSALVFAGGVEQELTKMKHEHAEVKAQVQDIQTSIAQSKERLKAAQDTLNDLKRDFEAHQQKLPAAKAWTRRAVILLNSTSLLSRLGLKSGMFMPLAYEDAIAEVANGTLRMDQLFPEVRLYVRLLRVVGWSFLVVSLLQERPSREELTSAIAYATQHNLWESKTVGPLRGVIGRMDAWISKAHKCLVKMSNKAQRVARLKTLLNEYSKLPLTCSWIGSLEGYVRAEEMKPSDATSAEKLVEIQTAAEAAAVAAMTAAAASTFSGASPAANQPKPPRKRKAYPKKDKSPAAVANGSAKKQKMGASSDVDMAAAVNSAS